MGTSMGKWPNFEYHGGKWHKYDRSGYNSSHPSLESPLIVWCIELTSSGHIWSFPTCLKMAKISEEKDQCHFYLSDHFKFPHFWSLLQCLKNGNMITRIFCSSFVLIITCAHAVAHQGISFVLSCKPSLSYAANHLPQKRLRCSWVPGLASLWEGLNAGSGIRMYTGNPRHTQCRDLLKSSQQHITVTASLSKRISDIFINYRFEVSGNNWDNVEKLHFIGDRTRTLCWQGRPWHRFQNKLSKARTLLLMMTRCKIFQNRWHYSLGFLWITTDGFNFCIFPCVVFNLGVTQLECSSRSECFPSKVFAHQRIHTPSSPISTSLWWNMIKSKDQLRKKRKGKDQLWPSDFYSQCSYRATCGSSPPAPLQTVSLRSRYIYIFLFKPFESRMELTWKTTVCVFLTSYNVLVRLNPWYHVF